MPIPVEVSRALAALKPPLKFGDPEQMHYIEVMQSWTHTACPCLSRRAIDDLPSIFIDDDLEPDPECRKCDGTGSATSSVASRAACP